MNRLGKLRHQIFLALILVQGCSSTIKREGQTKARILVYPFVNAGDQSYDHFSLGINESIIADLDRVSSITVIPERERKLALSEMQLSQSGIISEDQVISVGKMAGANLILTGSYAVLGNKVQFACKLVEIDTGQVQKSVKLQGNMDQFFELENQVIFALFQDAEKIQLAHLPKVTIRPHEIYEISSSPTPPLPAFDANARGLSIEDEDPEKAEYWYGQALARYPRYHSARRNLSSIRPRIYQHRQARAHVRRYSTHSSPRRSGRSGRSGRSRRR